MKKTTFTILPWLKAAIAAFSISFNCFAQTSFRGNIDYYPYDQHASVPDPTIAVSTNQILQITNGDGDDSGPRYTVWEKTDTSEAIIEYISFQELFNISSTIVDPIAVYDHLANKFIMIAMADHNTILFAISKTANPINGWNTWSYLINKEIDYPKISIWNNGYYITANYGVNPNEALTKTNTSSFLMAINRTQALTSTTTKPSSVIAFLNPSLKVRSICPVGLQGSTLPPSGTGGLFAFMQDDAWTSSTTDVDSVGLYEMDVNFTNSTYTLAQVAAFSVSAFKADICADDFTGYCIPSLQASDSLQATPNRVMNQPLYRNFGTHEGIVLTHIVDKGAGISGIRWYEIKRVGTTWSLNQQNTYGPDQDHRFLPSIAYDGAGNIALGYNASASNKFTSIRYTGRKSCDPLNQMTIPETTIIASTKAHTDNNRYGDYNHMVADPNGNSFWFTAEYNETNGVSYWATGIANITIPNCTTACPTPVSLSSSNLTSSGATLGWGTVTGANNYSLEYKTSSSSTWIVANSALTATSFNLTGLTASTVYDWRVRANCTSGSSTYATAQFTTTSSTTCSNNYEPNNTRAQAAVFPVNTTIYSMINSSTDEDFFKFNNSSSAKNIRVRLTNLPADYDLELFRNGSTSVLKSARHSGLGDEVFYYNTSTIAQYEVRVYPRAGGFSTNCYNLQIELSNTSYSSAREEEAEKSTSVEEIVESKGIYAFPIPADDKLNVSYFVKRSGVASISILSTTGEPLLSKQISSKEGKNIVEINVKDVPNGAYMLKVEQDGAQHTTKVILNH